MKVKTPPEAHPLEEQLVIPVNGKPTVTTLEYAIETRDGITAAIAVRNGKLSKRHFVSEVCGMLDVSERALLSDRRTAKIAFARQVAMYLMRRFTDKSLVEIGEEFHKQNGAPRDHGTIHHAVRTVEDHLAKHGKHARSISHLCSRLKKSFTHR